MSREETSDIQLCLFATNLTWHEFPQDVRKQVSQLLAAVCMEIVEELPASEQETHDESRSHSSLAP